MLGLVRKLKVVWVRRVLGFYDFTDRECCEAEFGCASIEFRISPVWKLELPRDFSAFLRALPELCDADVTLSIRAGAKHSSVDDLIAAWRETNPPAPPSAGDEDASDSLVLPVKRECMDSLAGLASGTRAEDVRFLGVDRPVRWRGTERSLLRWYQDGIELTIDIPEGRVRTFAEALSIGYRWHEESKEAPRWRLSNVKDVPAFLRGVLRLVGPGAVISIAHTDAVSGLYRLDGAVIVPFELCDEIAHLHIPLTAENIDALEPQMSHELLIRGFMHFSILRDDTDLLVCTRYGGTDVYMDIPKTRIDAFCFELGMKRRRKWRIL